MKLSVSAYRAHASAHKKILTSSYQQHYGSTAAPPPCNPLQPPQFTQPQLFDSNELFPRLVLDYLKTYMSPVADPRRAIGLMTPSGWV
ncbi:hypothetical protein EVAR_36762_1 [Eumeta japonica]|uniref:Uncharacterized protein n=1 Tax=Eumeta variegata TaxID=151549 RepID=A0A4C1X412_EUMVA|nr:hypothetical protein EVAR_36762_1 [Eumeta japonica]